MKPKRGKGRPGGPPARHEGGQDNTEIRGGYTDDVHRHISCHRRICNGDKDAAGKHGPVKNEVCYEQLLPLFKKQEAACDAE